MRYDPTPPCAGRGHLFFPNDTGSNGIDNQGDPAYLAAKSICAECRHRRQCAQEGFALRDKHSIRAGQRLWLDEEFTNLIHIAEGRMT